MGSFNSKIANSKIHILCNRCYKYVCDECIYIKNCFNTGVCKKCFIQRMKEIDENYT